MVFVSSSVCFTNIFLCVQIHKNKIFFFSIFRLFFYDFFTFNFFVVVYCPSSYFMMNFIYAVASSSISTAALRHLPITNGCCCCKAHYGSSVYFFKNFFLLQCFYVIFKPLSCLAKWNRRSWPLCIRLFNNHFFIIVKFVLCRYFHCFNGHPLSNLISDVIWIQTIKKQQKKIFLNGFYKEVTQ